MFGFVPGHGTLNIAPWLTHTRPALIVYEHGSVGSVVQNPLHSAEAHPAPPGQSWLTEHGIPLLAPPAHCFDVGHPVMSLIVPIWIVDRNSPDPMPPEPERRVRVGLLHSPRCTGVALQADPHVPPEPH